MAFDSRWSVLSSWVDRSSQLLIKKLSRNDCSWADSSKNGHQNGPYIPREIRESGIFPPLANLNAEKPHIFEAFAATIWPGTGEIKKSRFVHYSNKGPEMHLTRVPKEEFAALTPASLLVGGVLKEPVDDARYWFMTLDSESEEAELLESMFNIDATFLYGLFNPADALRVERDEIRQLIDELSVAVKNGALGAFISSVSKLPSPELLAMDAQASYLKEHGLADLNPYSIADPGNVVMKISRDIEYALYKRAERRHRAAEVLHILTKDGSDLITGIVRGFPELDAAFLSASQHRKSRAGRSFEHHIGRMLRDGKIPFEAQIITGTRRPDFVLPSLKVFSNKNREPDEALILSAKTTLRERWKQVALERLNCDLFLATVDDRVSADAIADMENHGICLVVPESLKNAKETCYRGKGNVITFRDFFDQEIATKRRGYWVN